METKISRSKKFHQSRNFQEVSKSSFFWWISLAGKYQMRSFPDLDAGFDINQGQFKILKNNFFLRGMHQRIFCVKYLP